MILVANRFKIADGYEEEFVERFRDSVDGLEDHDGFVTFELLTPASEETDTFVSATYWESRADFEAWTESQDFGDAHAGDAPREMFLAHPELEVHDVAFEYTGSD
ncbi:antibiotic biosynthesis monooxygenase family protein [Halobacterium wangiae]|uniref:antibiotic biosynthesis monooxygenase family protein n=1 Tax=Halobacterium wangiae TaxID=2902623 RepID=UPI001E2A8499|nr:antibiotic biosynthesis monooxygenase [Halobacterium wangiae]